MSEYSLRHGVMIVKQSSTKSICSRQNIVIR